MAIVPSDSARPKPSNNDGIRLNRYLAQCGIGSRRTCDRLIEGGLVAIDGTPVTSMGVRVFPFSQKVTVSGKPVEMERTVVLMVHKPRNVLCTVHDPEGRRTILDLIPEPWREERLYPVGRLDQNSEGLILVSNDGDLAHRLTHPRHHVDKEYIVWMRDPLNEDQIRDILRGVLVDHERLAALQVEALPGKGRFFACRMVLGEGRNRHIRRMCEAVDASVGRIKRIRIGSLELHDLPVGECRELSGRELTELRRQVGL